MLSVSISQGEGGNRIVEGFSHAEPLNRTRHANDSLGIARVQSCFGTCPCDLAYFQAGEEYDGRCYGLEDKDWRPRD